MNSGEQDGEDPGLDTGRITRIYLELILIIHTGFFYNNFILFIVFYFYNEDDRHQPNFCSIMIFKAILNYPTQIQVFFTNLSNLLSYYTLSYYFLTILSYICSYIVLLLSFSLH